MPQLSIGAHSIDTSHESARQDPSVGGAVTKDNRTVECMPACQMYCEGTLGSFCNKNGLTVSHEDAMSCPTVYADLAYRGTHTSTDHTSESGHDNATHVSAFTELPGVAPRSFKRLSRG